MRIAVVGCGFVGETVARSLENESEHIVLRIDPKLPSQLTVQGVQVAMRPDAWIVCVPTPGLPDGSCDTSIVDDVISQIPSTDPVLIKSTVPPPALRKYGANVSYSPEFLRADHAEEDFHNQEVFVLGATVHEEGKEFWWNSVFDYLDVPIVVTDRETASAVKYVHNAWLAIKTVFFGEIGLDSTLYIDGEELRSILAMFKNIGPSHMQQPGPDGEYGYGGHCFPKDTAAMLKFVKSDVLHAAVEKNNLLRKG